MCRVVATLVLLAHLGALAAPALAEVSPAERSGASHCVPQMAHADPGVTQQSEDCDACDMRYCLGMASCAHASVAIVPMTSIDLSAAGESASVLEWSSDAANLLRTPLSPPPKP